MKEDFKVKKKRISGNKEGEEKESDTLWQDVVRSVKSYSLHKKHISKMGVTPAKKNFKKVQSQSQKASQRVLLSRSVVRKSLSEGFDRSTEMKLRRGQLPLEGKLDLHGLTQEEAFDSLFRFIKAAVAARKRTVLIITGKGGLKSGGGILKRMLPLWLEDTELGKDVIALTQAAPKDGGAGAFYLRLRK